MVTTKTEEVQENTDRDFDDREYDNRDGFLAMADVLMLQLPVKARPGASYKWFRTSIDGQPDHRNSLRCESEGWRPVLDEQRRPIIRQDVQLFWRPVELTRRREQVLKEKGRRQMVSVLNSQFAQAPENDKGFRLFVDKETTGREFSED